MLHFHRLVGICPRESVPVTENKGEKKRRGEEMPYVSMEALLKRVEGRQAHTKHRSFNINGPPFASPYRKSHER